MERADLVFVGLTLEGPTATGVQRFRASRYLKGAGPREVVVATGVIKRPDGSGQTTSVSVEAAAGERWRIYATRRHEDSVLETNQCAGSTKLGAPETKSGASPGADEGRTGLILGATFGGLALLGVALGFHRRANRVRP